MGVGHVVQSVFFNFSDEKYIPKIMILQNIPHNIVKIKNVHKKKTNLLSENVFQTHGDKCLYKCYQKLKISGRKTENIKRFHFVFLSLFYMFHEHRGYDYLAH